MLRLEKESLIFMVSKSSAFVFFKYACSLLLQLLRLTKYEVIGLIELFKIYWSVSVMIQSVVFVLFFAYISLR